MLKNKIIEALENGVKAIDISDFHNCSLMTIYRLHNSYKNETGGVLS